MQRTSRGKPLKLKVPKIKDRSHNAAGSSLTLATIDTHNRTLEQAAATRAPQPVNLGMARNKRSIKTIAFAVAASLLLSGETTIAQGIPAAVTTDPPRDSIHPARMQAVHILSQGEEINGLLYIAQGSPPHPSLIFFHGLPGNEQNLDLAQSIRRAGWNVLTLHYRGSWGSRGTYSYQHQLEDAAAAVAFMRDEKNTASFGLDPRRLVLAGHSTGGMIAAITATRLPHISGLVLISASDDAGGAAAAHNNAQSWKKWKQDNYEGELSALRGCTVDGLAEEVFSRAADWSFAALAPHLPALPMLIITSDDGLAHDIDALASIRAPGGSMITSVHMATDHVYSDHRIALQSAVVAWLQGQVGSR